MASFCPYTSLSIRFSSVASDLVSSFATTCLGIRHVFDKISSINSLLTYCTFFGLMDEFDDKRLPRLSNQSLCQEDIVHFGYFALISTAY